jgi:vacuolar-type H+-ATPase subunit H
MDRETLIGIVEKQHHFRVDPNDPVFVLATISEVILHEAREDLRKIVAEALTQAAAANAQTEAAAREKAEAIVTKAGEWAAERIREAGETAATRILTDAQKVQVQSAIASQRIWRATIVAVVCSLAALAAAVSALVKLWTG